MAEFEKIDTGGPINKPKFMQPTFEDPYRGLGQDIADLGRVTVGMENELGRYLGEQLGEDNLENITSTLEVMGLGSLLYQGGKGGVKLSRKLTPKGREKAKDLKQKALKKQAVKKLVKILSKFGAKRGATAALGAGISAVFPPAATIAGSVVGALGIADMVADPETRQDMGNIYEALAPELATREGLKKMPSALERETVQRAAAQKRTSGLASLLEGRMKL